MACFFSLKCQEDAEKILILTQNSDQKQLDFQHRTCIAISLFRNTECYFPFIFFIGKALSQSISKKSYQWLSDYRRLNFMRYQSSKIFKFDSTI